MCSRVSPAPWHESFCEKHSFKLSSLLKPLMKDEVLWNTFRLRLKIFPKHFGELCVHSYRTFFLVFQTTKLFITLVAEISIHLRNNHSYSHTKSHWDCQTTPRQTDSRGCRLNHRRPWRASLFAEEVLWRRWLSFAKRTLWHHSYTTQSLWFFLKWRWLICPKSPFTNHNKLFCKNQWG